MRKYLSMLVITCLFFTSCYSKVVIVDRETEVREKGQPEKTDEKKPKLEIEDSKFNRISIMTSYDLIGKQPLEEREKLLRKRDFYLNGDWYIWFVISGISYWAYSALIDSDYSTQEEKEDNEMSAAVCLLGSVGSAGYGLYSIFDPSYYHKRSSTSINPKYTLWRAAGFKSVIQSSERAQFFAKVQASDFIIEQIDNGKNIYANNSDFILAPEMINITDRGTGIFSNLKARDFIVNFYPPDEDPIKKEIPFYSIKENIETIKERMGLKETRIRFKDPVTGKLHSGQYTVSVSGPTPYEYAGFYIKEEGIRKEVAKHLKDLSAKSIFASKDRRITVNKENKYHIIYKMNGHTVYDKAVSGSMLFSSDTLMLEGSRMSTMYLAKGKAQMNKGDRKSLINAVEYFNTALQYKDTRECLTLIKQAQQKYKRGISR